MRKTFSEGQRLPICVGSARRFYYASAFVQQLVAQMLRKQLTCEQLLGDRWSQGARFHGMEEVIGSIPIRSTK